jgi:hypothetical protein
MEAAFLEKVSKVTILVLYGQEDYITRIKSYLEKFVPSLNLLILSFPLQLEKPDKTEFDFSAYDKILEKIQPNTDVLVAFSLKYHMIARKTLNSFGLKHLFFYDALLDNTLKKEFFKVYFIEQGGSFRDIYTLEWQHKVNNKSVAVYMARCIVDKPLKNYPVLSAYIVPIQVGAALTKQKIAEVRDDTGENISDRNRRYSEMTAFYWMWKNATADYLGICHYRRLFVDLDKIVGKLQTTDIDAVLPLPTLCEKSVYEDYLLKHIPTVWQPMMEVLKEFSPEYYEAAQSIYQGRCFYASNMCILRREVLNDLCRWMFPIVMEIERRVGNLADPYYNRYAGFCTERLITLYFLYNKQEWEIAHAEKVFVG